MKKAIYISALAMLSGAGLSSCEDYLEAENKSAGGTTADQYFSTEKGLEGYRNYAYSLLAPLVNGSFLDMYDGASDVYWQTRGRQSNYDIFQLTAESGDFNNYYTKAYALINAANGVIEYGNKYDAEGKFLRAYGYFLLTQQFGAVPYVTIYINNPNREYPRTPLKEVYDGILKDLDDVLADANIPEISTDGLANKKAAAALAAKAALAAGWDLQTTLTSAEAGTYQVNSTDYFTRAAQYAERALDGVSLLDSFASKWSPFNENNQETFYALQYDRDAYVTIGAESAGGNGLYQNYSGYYGAQTTTGMKTSNSNFVKSMKGLYLWDKDDERYDATFQQSLYNYIPEQWGTTGYFAYLNVDAEKLAGMNVAYYYGAACRMTKEEFMAEVNAGVASGKWAYYKAGENDECPYFNASYAYYLGSSSVKVSFAPNGEILLNKDGKQVIEEMSYEELQQQVNSSDCVKKWDDPRTLQEGTGNSYRDVVLLHASETMLTAAEAHLMAGNTAKALEYVNKLRARAKTAELSSFEAYDPAYNYEGGYDVKLTALDVVLDERARELFGEPGRWVDLRRTKQMVRYNLLFAPKKLGVTVSTMSNGRGEIKWLRAIPSDEIGSNVAITIEDQNPGY